MDFIQTISVKYLKGFFTSGSERSVKAKKNILASFLYKCGIVLINLLIVPLTLGYLNPERYGIWLTLISIAGWIEFLDIGLGNGLRNKLAEALTNNDKILAKKFVSTTYALVTIIIIVIFLLFLIINPFINWSAILNTSEALNSELQILATVVIGFFSLRFILQLINTIFLADQRPAMNNLITFFANLTSLLIIYILTLVSNGSLIYLSMTLGLMPLALIIASLIFFNKNYKEFRPNYLYIDPGLIKVLAGLGLKFFIIQLSCIVLFTSDNIIISHLFGPAEVTPYFIAFKYFGISGSIFIIINSPFWSAYTEAYQKGDVQWIKNINYKLRIAWVIMTLFGFILLLMSGFIYKFWIGESIKIPFTLSVFMFIYFSLQNWASIYLTFVNGIAKVKLQTIFALIAGIINIPLAIFFAKNLNLGITGVILSTLICVSYGPIIARIQYKKIINGTARGIWNE